MRGDSFVDIGGIVDHHCLDFLFIQLVVVSISICTYILQVTPRPRPHPQLVVKFCINSYDTNHVPIFFIYFFYLSHVQML